MRVGLPWWDQHPCEERETEGPLSTGENRRQPPAGPSPETECAGPSSLPTPRARGRKPQPGELCDVGPS